ncbi:MAG: NAD(P)/FAD-dependent oxidoreductase [Gammaproteobacteria bacterium]
MTLQQRPCWWDTVTALKIAAESLPPSVDVAVVGGGITGLSAALAMARRGARVAVLESRHIGWGASSRNGGMVLTGLKLGAAALIGRYGAQLAQRLFQASLLAVNAVETLVHAERIDCDFRRDGHLALASKPAHFQRFQDAARLLAQEFNHEVQLVGRDELHREIGSAVYFGGLVDPLSGSIHPAKYVSGLARAALAAGANLHEATEVERIERHGQKWRLRTGRGALEAAELVVATSGYTGAVTGSLRRKIIPIGSYVIATEPLPEKLAGELSPRGRMMYDSRHFLHYFRLTPDRRLLFGGRARFVPETESTERQSAILLRRGMLQVFPQLRDAATEYAWGGTLDFAFDTMPHVGRTDGLHYALGYAGHGVALATHLGTQVGEALCGGGSSATPFAEIPFPGAPLGMYWGQPWFLPLVAARYRVLDWLH